MIEKMSEWSFSVVVAPTDFTNMCVKIPAWMPVERKGLSRNFPPPPPDLNGSEVSAMDILNTLLGDIFLSLA